MQRKKEKNNCNKPNPIRAFFSETPYAQINSYLAGIVVLVFIYSGIFPPTGTSHPIHSLYTDPVASTGLSRAFSSITRGNLTLAQNFNPFALRIFLFFLIQLFLRLIFNFILLRQYLSKKLLLFADVLLSVLLFLWAFFNLIHYQLTMVLE
jgi:hypothetical protein